MKIGKKQRRPVWSNKEQQEIWSSFLCARAYTLFLKRSRSKEVPALIDRILEGEEVEVEPANGAGEEVEVEPANGAPAAASDEPEVQDPANGAPAAASDEPEVQDPANGAPAAASDEPEDQDTANGAPAAASDEPEVQDPATGTAAAASDDPEDQDTAAASDKPEDQDPAAASEEASDEPEDQDPAAASEEASASPNLGELMTANGANGEDQDRANGEDGSNVLRQFVPDENRRQQEWDNLGKLMTAYKDNAGPNSYTAAQYMRAVRGGGIARVTQETETEGPRLAPPSAMLSADDQEHFVRIAEWKDLEGLRFEYGIFNFAFTIVLEKHPFMVLDRCAGHQGQAPEGPMMLTYPRKGSRLTAPGSMLLKVVWDCSSREQRAPGWNWSLKWLGTPLLEKLLTSVLGGEARISEEEARERRFSKEFQDQMLRKWSENLDYTALVRFLATSPSVSKESISPHYGDGTLHKYSYELNESVGDAPQCLLDITKGLEMVYLSP